VSRPPQDGFAVANVLAKVFRLRELSLKFCNRRRLTSPSRSSFRRDAETSTLQACAPQSRATTSRAFQRSRLLAVPGLRDVLNPWLADVTHQHEGQSVCVCPAEPIHARASAIFGDRSFPASLLNCHRVAGKSIGALDLCLWLCRCNVKRSVGINRPDRAERVGPLSSQRGRAGRDSFASSNHSY
jgi:hypothetical protein